MVGLLAIVLLAAPLTERASVVTRVTPPARLTVGDRFEVALTVTTPGTSLVTGPLADTLGVFAVASERRTTRAHGDRTESRYRLQVAGFAPGRHVLPPFTFLVQSGGRTDTLRSDTASVTIASVLPDSMKDIRALAPPETFPNLLPWFLGAAVLLLAVLVWIGARVLRGLRTLRERGEPRLPPWDEAIAALDALPWREWIASGQFQRYYYALSEVLKRYIERRFEFGAAEQTTTEMLASMRAHKTPMREDVARFFDRSDLVKYAKAVPTAAEAEAAIGQVREFVLKTQPAEPEPAAAAASPPAQPATSAGRA